MTSAAADSYLSRARGPREGAELLCHCCGGLLALGWTPGPDAVAALGDTVRCLLCRATVPVGTDAVADVAKVGFCSTWRLLVPDAA